jgi:3',5'-cyclic AMP phosphodiesterase CpdA
MKIIQLTDLHLVPKGQQIHQIDPALRFEQALANIKLRHPDLDLLVITGDLCNGGDNDSYRILKHMLAKYDINYQLVLGNHDHRDSFKSVFPESDVDPHGFIQSKIQLDRTVYLFLDTLQEGQVGGSYCEKRQEWLRTQLKIHLKNQIYVFLHHPPFKVGMKEMDNCNLSDGEILGEILNSHSNVGHLFCGHLHRPLHGVWKGIPFSCQPSTVHQFTFTTTNLPFQLIKEPPIYSVITLSDWGMVVHQHQYLEDAESERFHETEK